MRVDRGEPPSPCGHRRAVRRARKRPGERRARGIAKGVPHGKTSARRERPPIAGKSRTPSPRCRPERHTATVRGPPWRARLILSARPRGGPTRRGIPSLPRTPPVRRGGPSGVRHPSAARSAAWTSAHPPCLWLSPLLAPESVRSSGRSLTGVVRKAVSRAFRGWAKAMRSPTPWGFSARLPGVGH